MSRANCGFNLQPALLVKFGPTLRVQIGFDAAFEYSSGSAPENSGELNPALVDTGAFESCIDSQVAAALKLPVVDRRSVAGAQGSFSVNVHMAQIYVPDLGETAYGRFCGVHLAAGGQMHVALIGRRFLRNFTMTYEGRTGDVFIGQ